MSIDVALADLPDRIAARVGQAYLVTVRGTRPHVVSVAPAVQADGTIVVGGGRRTSANVAEHPEVTLLWPVDDGDPTHSLLVDGTAAASPEPDVEVLRITPTSAILHRVRAASDSTRR